MPSVPAGARYGGFGAGNRTAAGIAEARVDQVGTRRLAAMDQVAREIVEAAGEI